MEFFQILVVMLFPLIVYILVRLASMAYFNSKLEYEEKKRGVQKTWW